METSILDDLATPFFRVVFLTEVRVAAARSSRLFVPMYHFTQQDVLDDDHLDILSC